VIIASLKDELEHQASRSETANSANSPLGKEITVMSDKNIPYKLIKKIMMTCVSSKYTNISLAVVHKTKDKV
jgi:biopolymer transport protein TolR